MVDYSTPDAKLLLRAGAPRKEWLEARTQGVGASEISAILGMSPYATPYTVWADKMGYAPETEPNMAMRMGNKLEPIIRELFTEEKGLKVRASGLLQSKQNPYLLYTPDGLVEDGGNFEAKSTNGWLAHEWEDDQVPDHAELQVQAGMAVTGRKFAWVCGLIDGRDFFVRGKVRNDRLIKLIHQEVKRFWENYVLTGEAPPVDGFDVGPLKRAFPYAEAGSTVTVDTGTIQDARVEYEEATATLKAAEKDREDAAARLRFLAGENESVTGRDGITYATLKSNGQFSESKFRQNHPDLVSSYEIPSTTIDRKRLEKDHPELYAKHRARVLRVPKIKEEK